jgi:hypothetical protein
MNINQISIELQAYSLISGCFMAQTLRDFDTTFIQFNSISTQTWWEGGKDQVASRRYHLFNQYIGLICSVIIE